MLSAWVIDDDGWLANPGKSAATNTPARAIAVSAACDAAPAAVAAHATATITTAAARARVDRRSPEPIAAMYGLDARILDHLGLRRAATSPAPARRSSGSRPRSAFLVVVQVLWGPPAGIVVQGALLGGLSALLALGLALVYRAHRILNFAQGDLGAAPASLAVLLVVTSGASWLVAFVAGLATAVVLGVLVEVLVIRRFFRAPRLISAVATIGLAQVLAGIGLLLPGWFGVDLPPQSFPAPIDVSFTVEPLRFGGNDVVALDRRSRSRSSGSRVFLRTRIGLATRACADDVDRAALVGIPVRRVHSDRVGDRLDPGVPRRVPPRRHRRDSRSAPSSARRSCCPRSAAAVIGRMERLPTIAAAAIALGIVEQSVIWGWNQPSDVYPVLFVVVVVGACWLTPAGAGLREPARTVDVARRCASRARSRVARPPARGADRACAAPVGASSSPLRSCRSCSPRAAPTSRRWRWSTGSSRCRSSSSPVGPGEISLGQMAFVAVGAAVGGSLTARLGWDLALGLLGAGVVGAASRRADRPARAATTRPHPRGHHPRVRAGDDGVAAQPPHLRRGHPLRLAAAATRRATATCSA